MKIRILLSIIASNVLILAMGQEKSKLSGVIQADSAFSALSVEKG